jgi:hypothetical protein
MNIPSADLHRPTFGRTKRAEARTQAKESRPQGGTSQKGSLSEGHPVEKVHEASGSEGTRSEPRHPGMPTTSASQDFPTGPNTSVAAVDAHRTNTNARVANELGHRHCCECKESQLKLCRTCRGWVVQRSGQTVRLTRTFSAPDLSTGEGLL